MMGLGQTQWAPASFTSRLEMHIQTYLSAVWGGGCRGQYILVNGNAKMMDWNIFAKSGELSCLLSITALVGGDPALAQCSVSLCPCCPSATGEQCITMAPACCSGRVSDWM